MDFEVDAEARQEGVGRDGVREGVRERKEGEREGGRATLESYSWSLIPVSFC